MNGMGNGNFAMLVSCLLQISYAGRTEFGAAVLDTVTRAADIDAHKDESDLHGAG